MKIPERAGRPNLIPVENPSAGNTNEEGYPLDAVPPPPPGQASWRRASRDGHVVRTHQSGDVGPELEPIKRLTHA